jgi:ABC-type transport system involved in multi-copper enzyme maturation permease subunit
MNNPIIQRELIGMLRTRKALAIMLALPAALAVLVVGRWPSEGTVDLQGTQAMQVLRVFGYGLLVGIVLLAPVFPATSIVKERVQGSLALLLNSPLSPVSIVIGKLVSAVGYVLLLLLLSLPAAAACYAMGGIYLVEQLIPLYLVLFLTALSYAMLGLLVSSWAARPDSALRITYGLILLLAVVSIGPHQFLAGQHWLPPHLAAIADWLRCLSPLPAVMEVLGDLDVASAGLTPEGGVATRFLLLSAILTLLCAAWTTSRLGQRLLDRTRDAGTMTEDRSAGAQAFRRIMYLWFFDPQRRAGLIGPMTNPVMVKEQRCRRFGRGNWMMRLIMACMIISLLLMLATAWQAGQQAEQLGKLGGVMVLLQVTLIILITPSLASGLICSEIESRSWQLLQMTPLTAGTIVRGKLLSVVVTLVLILLATLPGYAVLIAIDPAQWPVVVRVLISLALTAVMALAVSAAVSSCIPNTAAATAVAYTLLVGLCIGTLLFWLGEGSPFGHGLVETILKTNPLAGALNLIEAPGFKPHQYRLVPANWYIVGGITVAALLLLITRTWQLTRPR